jgi:RNA polymerase sigma-70 factor (ECF subfamily)
MIIDPDLEIVKQCQSKDPAVYEAAFYTIYKKYGDRALNISYRILGNYEDALDVTQDVFIKVFKKIGDFRKDARFFTWFYRIVVNLSIDKRRKLGAHQMISESDRNGSLSEVPDNKVVTIDKLASDAHLEKRIQDCLLKLSENLRTVTVLRYIEGLSYQEVAETLECSIGTVKSRLNRAHKTLEELLRSELDLAREAKKDNA